ncbi:MAG: HEPN domain-containing protein [Planctomycetota bacterium]
MQERWKDWFKQAQRDLEHVRHSIKAGDFEWACFAAQQAAQKAANAVLQKHEGEKRVYSVTMLLEAGPKGGELPAGVADAAKSLDKHYIQARYPNSFAEGTPGDFYTDAEAKKALTDAEAVLKHCEGMLRG